MKTESEWKKFEASGQIEHYLQYKDSETQTVQAKENPDATHHDGTCASCDKNGGS
ncbi:MAG: hypothetical protein RR867_01140 [Ruthenibacterium sp.]